MQIDKGWLRKVADEFHRRADDAFDVVVSAQSWKKFAASNNIEPALSFAARTNEPVAQVVDQKGKQGRNALEGWNELHACLAMYLIKDVPRNISAQAIAKAVYEKLGTAYPQMTPEYFPTESTFEKTVQKLRKSAKKIW